MGEPLSQEDLEAVHCWEPTDRVPGQPAMTEFRRMLRYHQAMWREANGHPIGTQPMVPKPGVPMRLVGSRLPLEYAREAGANFLTAFALGATKTRMSTKEPRQSFDQKGLWADLLSSSAMCFNLVGELAADLRLADRAVHTWWPDTPGTVSEIRFAHSPGRLDPAYIGNLSAFDVAFVLDLGDGTSGILGISTKYHEWTKPETPKPSNRWRYLEVAERSEIFLPGTTDGVSGRSNLWELWLEHLLLLSMLQHPSGVWGWGRFVVVHPAGNLDFADACTRYRRLLADPSTFASATLEDLLDAEVLPHGTTAALRRRYVPG
jgi:hypothetical protein